MVENHQSARLGPVRYTVRFPEPQTHYAEIEAVFPTDLQPPFELFLPVWTPGSYLIREYARHVENVQANGAPLTKTRKNRWRVEAAGSSEIQVTYRIYCHEMSVRTNWVDGDFALLVGAATFLTPVNTPSMSYEVRLELPPGWMASATGLSASGRHLYISPDYDTLIDSPIYAGSPAIYPFEVDGIPHYLINHGEAGLWDGPRAAADVHKIVRIQREMWGSLPYTKYVFLNLITEGGGGLEHKNSVCMMTSRWAMRSQRSYLAWLSLVSHEFFHVWNVKRLRPAELGPFDYETENPTTSLWVAEGFTEYYGHLLVRRAGLYTREEYLEGCGGSGAHDGLSGAIRALQITPGRLAMPVAQSSFDAWIKLYRPDENTQNTSISYYVKGAAIAWLLDGRIRRATQDAKSLDDLMRLACSRYSGDRGYTRSEFQASAEEVAGIPLGDFFRGTVESTGELDYADALDWFGLRFRPELVSEKAWLGADTKNDAGRLMVTRIPRGTPAYASGLSVDDEIIAVDGFRVRPDQFSDRLEHYRPEDEVSILVARREKMIETRVRLGVDPGNPWCLEANPRATPEQRRHLENWLQ